MVRKKTTVKEKDNWGIVEGKENIDKIIKEASKEKEGKDSNLPNVVDKRLLNLKQYQEKANNVIPDDLKEYISETKVKFFDSFEFKIYVEEVRNWKDSHPDWDQKEDIDDINGIAMEKIIQYRLFLRKKQKKTTNIDEEYNKSVYREMGYRSNLGAKRSQREKGNNKGSNTTNIIYLSGKIEDENIKKIQENNIRDENEEESLFKDVDILDVSSEIVEE